LIRRFDADCRMKEQQRPARSALDEIEANSCYFGELACGFGALKLVDDPIWT